MTADTLQVCMASMHPCGFPHLSGNSHNRVMLIQREKIILKCTKIQLTTSDQCAIMWYRMVYHLYVP